MGGIAVKDTGGDVDFPAGGGAVYVPIDAFFHGEQLTAQRSMVEGDALIRRCIGV